MAPLRGWADIYTGLHMLAGISLYYVRLKEIPFLIGHTAFQIWPLKAYKHLPNLLVDSFFAWVGYNIAKELDRERTRNRRYDNTLRAEVEHFRLALLGQEDFTIFYPPVPADFPALG